MVGIYTEEFLPMKRRQNSEVGWNYVKFGYSEKATKFEKIFHLKFDVTQGLILWLDVKLLRDKSRDKCQF